MVRAIFRNGIIEPLDPLPAGWKEGESLRIESSDQLTENVQDGAGSDITMQDYQVLRKAIEEHRSEQKEYVRQCGGQL